MEFRKYLKERSNQLRKDEALNVSDTEPDGRGIRKVKFNPQRSRSLVEIPYHKGLVFNLNKSFQGLDNFLRLEGYDRARIDKVHQALRKLEISPSSPMKKRREDRDFKADDKFAQYLVVTQDPAKDLTGFTKNSDGSVSLFSIYGGASNLVFWPEGVKGPAHYENVSNYGQKLGQTIPIGKFPIGFLGWGRTDGAQNLLADAFSPNTPAAVTQAYDEIKALQDNSLTFVVDNSPGLGYFAPMPSNPFQAFPNLFKN